MVSASKEEERALSTTELNAVKRSRQPNLRSMGHVEVTRLRDRLRAMRDKARDTLRRQRRELRGKDAAKGVRAATDDTGSKLKAKLLSEAVARVDRKLKRREPDSNADQATLSRSALKFRKKQVRAAHPSGGRTAGKGMAAKVNKTIAPSGALNAEGQRPVLERSRKVR